MIVAEQEERLRCTTQRAHADLAARVLRLWRSPALIENPRRDSLLLATLRHADGWAGVDAAPRVHLAPGRPYDHRSLPEAQRLEIWPLASTSLLEVDPVAALFALQHLVCLADAESSGGWRELCSASEAQREALAAELGISLDELATDGRWLELVARLSLALCEGSGEELELAGHRALVTEETLRIQPFPLAGATTFPLDCRSIPKRRYVSDVDLSMELATARWQRVGLRIAPFPSPDRPRRAASER